MWRVEISDLLVTGELLDRARARRHALTISVPSSLTHNGIGVPQKREREMDQSRASFSQFSKRASPTKPGTQ